jgi:Tol biopolymer transport system component
MDRTSLGAGGRRARRFLVAALPAALFLALSGALSYLAGPPAHPGAEAAPAAAGWDDLLVVSQPHGLVTVSRSTGEVLPLLAAAVEWEMHGPAVSPDGSWIAFSRGGAFGLYGYPEGELVATDTAGNLQVSYFRPTLDGETAVSPAWSADGNWLYYVRTSGSNGLITELVRDSAYGGAAEVLRQNAYYPSVSRDGKLAFLGATESGGFAVFVADAAGGGERQLTAELPYGFLLYPRISPDGRNVVFAAAAAGPPPAAARLALPVAPRETFIGLLGHGPPALLWTVSTAGGNPRRVSQFAFDDPIPTWSPDSRTLAYATGTGLFAVPASGGPALLLSDAVIWGEPDWPN